MGSKHALKWKKKNSRFQSELTEKAVFALIGIICLGSWQNYIKVNGDEEAFLLQSCKREGDEMNSPSHLTRLF